MADARDPTARQRPGPGRGADGELGAAPDRHRRPPNARVAAKIARLRQHLRLVSRRRGSPIEPPEKPGFIEVLEILDELEVDAGGFFFEVIYLWLTDLLVQPPAGEQPRGASSARGGEEDEAT